MKLSVKFISFCLVNLILLTTTLNIAVSAGTPVVNPGTDVSAVILGGMRYRELATGNDYEAFLGIPDLGDAGRRTQTNLTWGPSNAITLAYDPVLDKLVATVDNGSSDWTLEYTDYSINVANLVYAGDQEAADAALARLNYMQISTTLREGSPAAFSLDDVDLDGNSLGSFPGVHHGTENWQVNGYDLSSGFTFSGTLNLSGINSPSAELSKVDITLGYVNTDTFAPSVSNVSAVPNPQTGSSSVTLTATIDDTNSGGLNIKSAEYRLGAGTWIAMSAADGAFDSPVENVTAVFAAPEADGEHTLCVRGTDAEDNISSEQCSTLSVDSVGPISSAVLMVPNPADPSAQITLTAALNDSSTGNSNIASAEYQVSAGSWSPMAAQDGTFDSPVETVTVKFPAPASSGQVEVCVRGIDAAGNTGAGVCEQMQVNETAQTPVLYLPILSNIAAAP